MTKAKEKLPKPRKPSCEVKTQFCSGELMKKYTGFEVGDPVFYCCGACMVILRRQGVRMKEAA